MIATVGVVRNQEKSFHYYGRRSYEGIFYMLTTTVGVVLYRYTNLPCSFFPVIYLFSGEDLPLYTVLYCLP
jgi:hypothetical protein